MQNPSVIDLPDYGPQNNGKRPSGPPPLPHLRDAGDPASRVTGAAAEFQQLSDSLPRDTKEFHEPHDPKSSGIERFLEAFLQERNIKWMLGLGVLILLGSSLMFVVQQWDAMGAFWQYTVLLGYTGAIHLCGQVGYHRFGLRKTGTGLMSLTLLLIPLGFFSLKWIAAGSAVQAMLFLVPTTLFSGLAARRIFKHFLHGDRLSVLVSYLSLSLMGALAPTLVAAMNLPALWLFATWTVFAFGSVKANREVFWLVEEHRKPRIFGFFPIALFGLQFLAIFALHFNDVLAREWIGFGCVLTAIPVLMTADVIARVFQQRTGDLVRPLPWSVSGPIVAGLIVSIVGLVLSGTGTSLHALVPASAVFALLMGLVAHRTKKQAFSWAMLFGVVMAYQFSPVFFQELARSAVNQAATAVNRERLPLPLYGLTYLPLLIGCSLVSRSVRNHDLFAKPLQHFTMGLSAALFGISFLDPTAIFLVPAAMSVFFLWQAFWFRRTEPSTLAIVAAITATARLVPYFNSVSDHTLPVELGICLLGGLAMFCQLLGRRIDRAIAVRAGVEKPIVLGWHNAAILATGLTLCAWVGLILPGYSSNPAPLSGLVLIALLATQAVLAPKRGFGYGTLLFALFLLGLHLSVVGVGVPGVILVAESSALFTLWVYSRLTERRTDRFAIAFSSAARHVSLVLLPVCVVSILWCVVGYGVAGNGVRWGIVASGCIATVWCFGIGRRHFALATVGFISVLALQVPLVGELLSLTWVPVAWASTCFLTLLGSRELTSRLRRDLEAVSLIVLTLIAAVSLVFFTVPLALASGIALVAFFSKSVSINNRSLRGMLLVVLNWQLLTLLLRFLTGHTAIILDLEFHDLTGHAALPMAAALALSFAFFGHRAMRQIAGDDSSVSLETIIEIQRFATAAMASLFLLFSLGAPRGSLGLLQWICVAITFAVPAVTEWRSALRTRRAAHVWGMLACIGTAAIYLTIVNAITLGPLAMFAAVGLTLPATLIARSARNKEQEFIAGPLSTVARLLPAITVGVSLIRFFTAPDEFALNSLAALMAAAYYFWCGIEEKRRSLIVFAASIANVVWFLVCLRLEFGDPQFFLVPIGFSILGLVELLKREIPAAMRNPLRYVGALMILVSPAFNLIGGDWLQLLSLMVFSVLVALAAIGLRARPLLYTGTAFLVVDIIAMVCKGVSAHHELLWLGGLLAGGAVIGLAALFENHREKLLSQVRFVTTKLQAWD